MALRFGFLKKVFLSCGCILSSLQVKDPGVWALLAVWTEGKRVVAVGLGWRVHGRSLCSILPIGVSSGLWKE